MQFDVQNINNLLPGYGSCRQGAGAPVWTRAEGLCSASFIRVNVVLEGANERLPLINGLTLQMDLAGLVSSFAKAQRQSSGGKALSVPKNLC